MTTTRTRRPQAEPLWKGATWQITRADLWAFGALLATLGGLFGMWRAFSP